MKFSLVFFLFQFTLQTATSFISPPSCAPFFALFIYLFIYLHKCGKITTPKLPHSLNSSPIPIPQESVNQVVSFCDSLCFYFSLRAKNYRIRVSLSVFVSVMDSWTPGQMDNCRVVSLISTSLVWWHNQKSCWVPANYMGPRPGWSLFYYDYFLPKSLSLVKVARTAKVDPS